METPNWFGVVCILAAVGIAVCASFGWFGVSW